MGLFCLGLVCLFNLNVGQAYTQSNYAISIKAPFNQPDFYPLDQSVDSSRYQPVGEWTGRLILPTLEELKEKTPLFGQQDWVWLELHNTAISKPEFRGKIVPLTWQDKPHQPSYVEKVTTDIQFNETAKQAQKNGNVLPSRLNGRTQVGPLQSLAGARPNDDLIVKLTGNVVITEQGGQTIIQIANEPKQITGRYYGLVQILGEAKTNQNKTPVSDCPGILPCPGEYYQVRHYNRASQQFDGAQEIVRIPQQPRGNNGRFISTPRHLETVETGRQGWYIYGAKDRQGIFTVQSLKPRALVQLNLDAIELRLSSAQHYIYHQNWKNTPQRKGSIQRVLLTPQAENVEQALNEWQEGDYGLVIHAFGGIGGEQGENIAGATVTGHFSYGMAQVIKDPFTDELQFDLTYYQVYAQNPEGIISGTIDWSAYAGDWQRGWIGSRPFSDVVVKLDALSDFQVGDQTLSFGRQLLQEAQTMTARYRTGDGTGVSSVTPSTSCVQDSSQAFFIAIAQLRQQVTSSPDLRTWLQAHPNEAGTQKFEQLKTLVQDLNKILVPYGVVRADWQNNAKVLAGVAGGDRLTSNQRLLYGLKSWRTMVPRRAHDEVSTIFLHNNASLWFLRSNQILGWDSTILPLAPTLVLGKIPIISTGLTRLIDAVLFPLSPDDWSVSFAILLGYGMIVLPIGWKTGFLRWHVIRFPSNAWWGIFPLFLMPALVEELVFRVILLPHPLEGVTGIQWLGWATLSLSLFIIYHPLNALWFYPQGKGLFWQPMFLLFAGLLGIACTLSYRLSGSLWPPVMIHWLVAVIWLFILGGTQQLKGQNFGSVS